MYKPMSRINITLEQIKSKNAGPTLWWSLLLDFYLDGLQLWLWLMVKHGRWRYGVFHLFNLGDFRGFSHRYLGSFSVGFFCSSLSHLRDFRTWRLPSELMRLSQRYLGSSWDGLRRFMAWKFCPLQTEPGNCWGRILHLLGWDVDGDLRSSWHGLWIPGSRQVDSP